MSLGHAVVRQLADYDNPRSMVARLRARRLTPLLGMIESVFKERGSVRLLDIGGTEDYWRIMPRGFLESHKVKITVLNLPGSGLPADHGLFTFIEGDACRMTALADKSFDIAHSNSVLEHVGDWARMVEFASEVERVAQRSFVQTPNYWFLIEPHAWAPCFHWLPKPAQVWLVLHFRLGTYSRATTLDQAVRTVESARLITRAMLRELFKGSRVETERVFGLPKSLLAIRP